MNSPSMGSVPMSFMLLKRKLTGLVPVLTRPPKSIASVPMFVPVSIV